MTAITLTVRPQLQPNQTKEQLLLNVLYHHGLLVVGTTAADFVPSTSGSRSRAVPVTAWASPAEDSTQQFAATAGKTLPQTSLELIERNLNILFSIGAPSATPSTAPRMNVNFLRLAVELVRVVRDVAQPLRRELSGAGTHTTPTAAGQVLNAAAMRFGNKMYPSSIALSILAAVFNHDAAMISHADMALLVQFSRDITSLVVCTEGTTVVPPTAAPSRPTLALGTSWQAMGALVASIARRHELSTERGTTTTPAPASTAQDDDALTLSDVSIGTAALRAMNDHDAWRCSGVTLFLSRAYLAGLSRIVQTLVWSPLFQSAFDNTLDAAAKIVWSRIGTRPPITAHSTRHMPSIPHAVMFLAANVGRAVDRIVLSASNPPPKFERPPMHLFQKRVVADLLVSLRRLYAQPPAGGDAIGLFQWLTLAIVAPTEVPAGLTADPEALMERAQRTSFATFDDPEVRAAIRPTVLQALVAYIRECTCVPVVTMDDDTIFVLVEAVALELLQLRVSNASDIRGEVKDVPPAEMITRLVQERCMARLDFFAEFVQRIVMRFARHAFEHVMLPVKNSTLRGRQGPVLLEFCKNVYFCFGPALAWTAMEMLDAPLVSNVATSLSWLAPLLLALMSGQPVWLGTNTQQTANGSTITQQRRNPERDRLGKLYLSSLAAATALGSRLDRERGAALIDEAKKRISKVSQLTNVLYSGHVEVLLAALRSPVLCGKLPQDRLLQDWSALVLPILNGQHAAPVSLQVAAHDCMIAPILSKRAKGLMMVPTYVAMFCPVQGISQRYPDKSVDVIRSFSKSVRSVVDHLEKLDVNDDSLRDREEGLGSAPEAPMTASPLASVSAELTPLSAILLVVQGLFDQIRLQLQRSASTPTQEQSQRQDLYISGLVNLLQCSNPKVTSRVCTSIEVVVLDYLAHHIAFQEKILKFASEVVLATANDSVKKPVGEWLLRLTNEARGRRVPRSGLHASVQQKSKL